jgi:hypothetical protein
MTANNDWCIVMDVLPTYHQTGELPAVQSLDWNGLVEEHYGQHPDGPLEVLRNPGLIDSAKHYIAAGTIALAEAGVQLGLLYAGDRIFESDHNGLPNPAPAYKVDTMRLSEDRQTELAVLRATGQFIKGVHDKRTRLGEFLAKTSLDEIPGLIIHLLTGDLKLFGKSRPVMAEEMVGQPLLKACEDQGHAPIDVSRNQVSGLFNETAVMLGRVLDKTGWPKWVRANMQPMEKLSSKGSRLRATFSKDFLKQTTSSEAEDTSLRRRASDHSRRHMIVRARSQTKKSHLERVG